MSLDPRGSYWPAAQVAYHVRLEFRSNDPRPIMVKKAKRLFHHALRKLVFSYPIGEYRYSIPFCEHCHGMVWNEPMVEPWVLTKIAEQIKTELRLMDFRVKIHQWKTEATCRKKSGKGISIFWKSRRDIGDFPEWEDGPRIITATRSTEIH